MRARWRSRPAIIGVTAAVVVAVIALALARSDADPGASVTAGAPPTTAPPPDEPFADVPDDHPLRDDVSWLLSRGATGYPDGTFRPDEPISREDLVHLLWTLDGSPTGPFEPIDLSDVPTDSARATAVAWAIDAGIVTDLGDGTFGAQTPVSHEEAASILLAMSGLEENPYAPAAFSDVDPTSEHFTAISFLDATNISDGYADGTFRPTEPLTRIEAAMVLRRFSIAFEDVWPAPHHGHECNDPITPEQRAAADELFADTLKSLERWPTVEAAEAAGFVRTTPFIFGNNAHLVNVEYANDGITLDPMRPESLMTHNGTISAAMFVMEQVKEDGPKIGGCLTQWHAHSDFCYDGPPKLGGFFVTTTDQGCPAGSMLHVTPQMLHVWIVPRLEGPGPFDGDGRGM